MLTRKGLGRYEVDYAPAPGGPTRVLRKNKRKAGHYEVDLKAWRDWLNSYEGGPFDSVWSVGYTIEPIPRPTGRYVIDDLYGAVQTKRGRRR